jgi:hypothetical protein
VEAQAAMRSSPKDPRLLLSPVLAREFALLHKRALGTAVGLTAGMSVSLITAFHVIVHPADALDLGLLSHYFYGYSVSWQGIGVGFFWGFATGFATGWFMGFARNFMVTAWLLVIRTKANLAQPFLDDLG